MDQTEQSLLASFSQGTCHEAYHLLGCHRQEGGYCFRVWAPHAQAVFLTADFNYWNPEELPLEQLGGGVWGCFTPRAYPGCRYKYYIVRADGSGVYKSDPYGVRMTALPDTDSVVPEPDCFAWTDGAWRKRCRERKILESPVNIYEMHLGSWRRKEDGSVYGYRELADILPKYLVEMGYTHVEFLPLAEHPFGPSWGYQVTGFYAPTARYGSPEELRYLVNALHRAGIGVILDWVPAHFPKDENGLYEFDGSCLYEKCDARMNEHRTWGTRVFDYGKPEVRSFLVSNAVYWLREFHFDGLRVDAVSSMLYLDYNRPDYVPNHLGGREDLEAIGLLQAVNRAAFRVRPDALVIAEESTAFAHVTKPDYDGGLGFLFKWNMGWMNDTLRYMSLDPVYRQYEHQKLTFSMTYAGSENFILPLSHDEVVHGKCSLIGKMPGEYDQKFANLRGLLAYQMAHPGKKLTFMGTEIAQFSEWDCSRALDWELLGYERHRQMQGFVRALNRFYRSHSQLWQDERSWDGFQWIEPDASGENILAFRRLDKRRRELLVVCNFCPVGWENRRLGVPRRGRYCPVFSTDDVSFGGSGAALGTPEAEKQPYGPYRFSARFQIPPMSVTFYARRAASPRTPEERGGR